jgi:hypothetical protein
MKPNRIAMVVLASMALTSSAAELTVSTADIEHARLYLKQTQDLVIGATKGLSKQQWAFKPAPDRWSIAEIVEHMVAAQEYVLGPVWKELAKAPAPGERDTARVDEIVIDQMPDRTAKFRAPEFLQPTGHRSPAECMERLLKNYAELRRYLETTPDLRAHAIDAPALKAISKGAYDSIDGYQALLLVAAHTERHTKQILEVRADAGFPAR